MMANGQMVMPAQQTGAPSTNFNNQASGAAANNNGSQMNGGVPAAAAAAANEPYIPRSQRVGARKPSAPVPGTAY